MKKTRVAFMAFFFILNSTEFIEYKKIFTRFEKISTNKGSVWLDWAINWTLGKHSKPVATIILPKSLTFLGNFCKVVKIIHFSCEIILGNFYRHLVIFFWSHCKGSRVHLVVVRTKYLQTKAYNQSWTALGYNLRIYLLK